MPWNRLAPVPPQTEQPFRHLVLIGFMAAGKSVAAEIGRAMAAVHALPRDLVTKADLPSYTANEFRQRRLNELDQAATTGKIPSVLLRRWEHALEDVSLWRFKPTVVHGDLHEDNILLTGERVSAVTGWTDLRVGDPADDFAWLIAANDPRFTDAVHSAYLEAGKDPEDPHLIRRAALSAEFALAQWLVRGVAAENDAMVEEAVEMLRTLEEDVRGQEASDRRAGQVRAADAAAEAARFAADAAAEARSGRAGARPDAGKVTVAPIEPTTAPAAAKVQEKPDVPQADPGKRQDTSAVVPEGAPADSGLADVIALPARGETTGADTAAGMGTDRGMGTDGGADGKAGADGEAPEAASAAETDSAAEADRAARADAKGPDGAADSHSASDTAGSDDAGSDAPGSETAESDTGTGKGSGPATTALPLVPVRDK